MNNYDLERFESLGDNCEFGFYLRSKGLENGSLFRWSLIKDHQDLLNLVTGDFVNFYQFDNLQPTWSNMLVDKDNGIIFHTDLYSSQIDNNWVFDDAENERKEKYLIEKNKINYLVKKFLDGLKSNKKIFVIKKNNNQIDMNVIALLANELNRRGKAKILVVFQSDDSSQHGVIEHAGENVLISYIERFAEYNKADDISVAGWDKIVNNILHALPSEI
ncbi:hypothetical protein [Serratia plymuthica]|uniref:Papain-like cysteine peptidase n=1 Tax=Serratia plymuthica S13 TaxID=1348660 RepID=S4YQ55_SERPL|nr:hypothetical protein [Serratia plymuthica]AGP46929.1 hypothetical protein M621_08245 [Serratia plymuthica S13]AHY06558.1 hypothetical protein sch_08295 [Serratia plymuthica]EKF65119.1 hypothetical protein B194_1631 [Serratia plymuthica A30]KYG15488.1 hypothetical protein SOD10_36340 [Serratia plymuthica]MBI6137437.1 hypothetical protein [Serratia plymuthica]